MNFVYIYIYIQNFHFPSLLSQQPNIVQKISNKKATETETEKKIHR